MDSNFSCEEYVGDIDELEDSQLGLQIISLILLAAGVIIVSTCYIYYLTQRKKYEILQRRNIFLQTVFVIGVLVLIVNYCLRSYIGSRNFSCRLYSLLVTVQLIFVLQSVWIRLFSLIWRINYNTLLISQTYLALTRGELEVSPGSVRFVSVGDRERRGSINSVYGSSFEKYDLQLKPTKESFFYKLVGPCILQIFSRLFCFKPSKTLPRNLRVAKLFASTRFAIVLFVIQSIVVSAFVLAVEFTTLPYGETCFGCSYAPSVNVVLGFMGISSLLSLYAFWRLRVIDDGIGIRKELIILALIFLVDGLFAVVILDLAFAEYQDEGYFESNLLSVISSTFAVVYLFPYQVRLARLKNTRKDVDGDDEQLLKKILDTRPGTQAYALFLANNLCLENLFFYNAATNWKENFDQMDDAGRHHTAEEILNQFFRSGGVLRINISQMCLEDTEYNFKNNMSADIFDEAIETAWEYLISDTFTRFKETAYYKAFSNELQG